MLKHLCILGMVALMAGAADLELKLNEGDVSAIKLGGDMAAKTSIRIIHPEGIEWETGRDGKPTLSFKDAPDGKIPSIAIKKTDEMDFTKPFTLMCWIKPNTAIKRGAFHEIISNSHSDRGPGPRMTYGWDALRLTTGDGKTCKSATSKTSKNPIKNGAWNHLAAVSDGSTVSIYVNGIKADTLQDMVLLNGEKEIYIGSYRGGSYNGFYGAISDVKIYFKALDDKAIITEVMGLVL